LGCDLMLCTRNGSSILRNAIDLDLELMGLAVSILMLQQGLLEVL